MSVDDDTEFDDEDEDTAEDGEADILDVGSNVMVKRSLRDIANKIARLLIQGRRADYDLGRELDRVYTQALYQKWPGFETPPTYAEWTWRVLGFKERKARNLRENFLNLAAMNLADDSLARALRLGWTKLTAILRVARTENDLLAWIDKVEEGKIKEDALTAEVRLTAEAAGIESRPGNRKERHQERLAAADDPATVASTPPLPPGSLPRGIKVYMKLAFDEEEALRIFVRALEAIKHRYSDMGNGKAATLMATAYMAAMPRDDQGGTPVELAMLIKAIENTHRIRLQVVKQKGGGASEAPTETKVEKKGRRGAAEMD